MSGIDGGVRRLFQHALGLCTISLAISARPAQAQSSRPEPLAGKQITLLDAIRLGRTQGVNAALARLQVRSAEARTGERRADLLPTIAGAAGVTRQTLNLEEFGFPGITGVTDPFDVFRVQIRAQQTIFDASTIVRLRAARDTAVASGFDARAVGDLAGATSGLAYLRVLSAEETVRAREADSVVAATLFQQARRLVETGVSPAIDLTRSEVSFAAVRTQLEVARNTRDRSRLDLLRTLDLSPGTEIRLADSLGMTALTLPTDPARAGQFARGNRVELRAERARTEAARRNLQAIRYEYLPNLSANGSYGESGQTIGGLRPSYTLQLLLNVPILDGFRRQNRSAEQRARVEAQEIRERDLGNQVETEAREAVLDLASARQQVAIAGERLRLADQELTQAEERFRAGVAGSVETTNAQSSVIAARDALIQARVGYGTARVTAYRALGIMDQLH